MKVFRSIEKYLLYASPAVLVCVIWSAVQDEKDIAMPIRIIWELLAWDLLLWFALLTFYVICLLLVAQVREDFFKRVANIKERDEREELLSGLVAKRTFISTLSLLVFLFFISTLSFNIQKLPPGQTINGKTTTASITFNLKILDEPREKRETDGLTIIETRDVPLSKSSLLLIIIFWQLLAYRLFFWRESQIA